MNKVNTTVRIFFVLMYSKPATCDISELDDFGEIISGNVLHEYPKREIQSTIG